MNEVITFLAQPPHGVEPGTSDGNFAIEQSAELMTAAVSRGGRPYQARLFRAAYVNDIAYELANLPVVPRLIQIVGHGSPGRLQLGAYWGRAEDAGYRADVLDSSPDSYGLLDGLLHPQSTLLLVGCSIGGSAPSGYVGSGRALLFDVEDMSGCHAYAASDLVTSADFVDDFIFGGPLSTSLGKPANPVAPYLPRSVWSEPPPTSDEAPELVTITAVRGAAALGRPFPTAALPATRLLAFPAREVPGGLFAMTELELETNLGRVDVICAGSLLRVQPPGEKVRYYRFKEDGHVGTDHDWLIRLREAYTRDEVVAPTRCG